MTETQERLLAELIYDKMSGIQKSKEIFEKLSKWEQRTLNKSDKELKKNSKIIASKVHGWHTQEKDKGNKPSPGAVMQRVREEPENL